MNNIRNSQHGVPLSVSDTSFEFDDDSLGSTHMLIWKKEDVKDDIGLADSRERCTEDRSAIDSRCLTLAADSQSDANYGEGSQALIPPLDSAVRPGLQIVADLDHVFPKTYDIGLNQ